MDEDRAIAALREARKEYLAVLLRVLLEAENPYCGVARAELVVLREQAHMLMDASRGIGRKHLVDYYNNLLLNPRLELSLEEKKDG